jgi:hypothetical protein
VTLAAGRAWVARPHLLSLVDVALLGGAAVAWIWAVAETDIDRVGDLGLLGTIHPLYFVAPVLCVAGFVAELLRGARRPWILAAYVVMVILIIHATTPLLLDQPQHMWAYRGVGVVELIASRGTASGADDVYQRWPAAPAAAAQLATISGVDPMRLVAWAPVPVNLAASVLLFAIARTLTADRRVAYLTILLFQCVNWDYLGPQGLAFLLSLTAVLVVVRWLRPADPPRPWARLPGPSAGRRPGRLCRLAALGAFALIMTTLAAAHPVAPFVAAGAVVMLTVFGIVRPWWTAAIAVAIPLFYLGLVDGSYVDGLDALPHTADMAAAGGSRGQEITAVTVRTLALVVWFLALLAAFRDRRSMGRVLTPLTLAVLPFALALAGDHGGEAIHRVYLFSAPWCALLIADMACQLRWPRALRAGLAAVTICAMLFATVQGRHGQLLVDRQLATEVAAARHLYERGRPGAAIVLAAPNFPTRLTATYDQFNRGLPHDPDLISGAGLVDVRLTDAYLPLIERYVRSIPGTTRYLVISDGMRRYAAYFGVLPDGSLDQLDATLAAAPQWTVFYRNPDVVIYELTP